MQKPLVSIVTPAYNDGEYLPTCLRSVREQEYPNVEHIVVDGDSDDDTVRILESEGMENDSLRYVSEPDGGMYDAIEKGFNMAEGDILAWLNADDRYFPWTCERVVRELDGDGVEWITGHAAYLNEKGSLEQVDGLRREYRREWLRKGWYYNRALGFVQQESTFWTRSLWERAGGFQDGIELAGDYWLWRQFAEIAELHTVPTVLAAWRSRPGQLSGDGDGYLSEVDRSSVAEALGRLQADRLYSVVAGL